MSRGMKAQQRRRIRRAANRRAVVGVSKAQDQTPEPVESRVTLVNGRIVRRVPGRRAAAKRALSAAGVSMDASYDLAQGSLIERKFYAAQIDAGFTETRRAAWPSEGTLADHGEVLYRDEHGGVFRLDDGSVVYAQIAAGWFNVRVASPSRETATDVVASFSSAYPPLYRETSEDGTIVPITFWTNSKWGPSSRLRMIDSAEWGAIEGNYTAAVRDELTRLMTSFEPGKDGQLLLWQGPPGTGKTWALRALATEWKPWAEFNYITDPDAFFVQNPAYMIDVLLHDSYEELTVDDQVVTSQDKGGKWRVLILEDTGELLSADAKDAYGQGLSRLLNVVDGMVGQGLRVLAIVTTNDELGELHPAVTRPGRCASQIEFGPLSVDEANEWLAANPATSDGASLADGHEGATLAELYALAGEAATAFADADGDNDGDQEPDNDEGDMAKCANCGHTYAMHSGDGGACTVEGCSCGGFEASTTAAGGWIYVGDPFENGWGNAPATTSGATTVTLTFDREPVTADGAVAPPLPDEHQPGEALPRRRPSPAAPSTAIPLSGTLAWTATLCPEGKATDDGRIFAPGSITWRELPLTLMAMTKTDDGHDGAEVAGRIDRIWREGGMIRASGVFDSGEFGSEIARLVTDGTLRGVSVDIAPQKVDIAYRSQVVDENGYWREDAPEEGEGPSIGEVMLGNPNPDDPIIYVVREAVLGMATVCPFQAFADATIETEASLSAAASPVVWTVTTQAGWTIVHKDDALVASVAPEGESVTSLTASAAGLTPEQPPVEWFEAPDLPELSALTVTPEGRVYGHAAPWGFCHIGFPDSCRTAPVTATNYAYFHLKEVECEDGSRVPCGTITLDTGHADHSLGRAAAARHYDDTGTAVADVVVGEDEYGIWVAGALRGDVDADAARKLRGASLSGDWRNVNGNLELVALLAVNVPGFPVPRPTASLVASGGGFEVSTLIAAGVHMGLGGMTPAERAQFEALQDVVKGEYEAIRLATEDGGGAA